MVTGDNRIAQIIIYHSLGIISDVRLYDYCTDLLGFAVRGNFLDRRCDIFSYS